MNVLISLIGLLMAVWGAWWFLDRNQPIIGMAMTGVVLMLVVWLVQAIVEVGMDARGTRSQGRRGR